MKDIQVFLSFAIFYQRSIKAFAKIAAFLTLILQTILGFTIIIIRRSNKTYNNKVDGGGNTIYDKKEKRDKCIRAIIIKNSTNFFSLKAWAVFICLSNTFTETPILHLFDPEHHIRIEIDVFGYAICRVMSQLWFSNDYVIHKCNHNHLPLILPPENSL